MEPKLNLDDLPPEMITQFLLKLDLKDLANYCRTSQTAARYCQSNSFWKDKYRHDFGPSIPTLSSGEKWIDVYKRKASKIPNSPIAVGFMHYAMIDDQGILYTSGENSWGQLGNGTKNTLELPFMVLFPKVISVACGTGSTIAITEAGETYGWGQDIFSDNDYRRSILKPTRIKYLVENPQNPLSRAEAWITDTEIHMFHTEWSIKSYKAMKVSCNGSGWGVVFDNDLVYYSIHIGRQYKKITGMVTLKDGILDISVSNVRFSMISKNGQLYMFGTNFDDTYIGTRGGYSKAEPTEIILPLKLKIKQISLSQTNIMILSENGNVYTWGNTADNMGIITTDMTPKKLSNLPKISFISSAAWVMAAITTEAKLYMWGRISYNGSVELKDVLVSSNVQVDIFNDKKYVMLPTEINIGNKVNYIAAGERFSIASTEDGRVNYWGDPHYKPN